MENLKDNIYRKPGKGVILTKDIESGMDMCPHEWRFIERRYEYDIYECEYRGYLRFDTQSRTALDDFIRFLRSYLRRRPKVEKIPEKALFGLEKIKEDAGMTDFNQVKKYAEVVEGFDIDGVRPGIARVETDGHKKAIYRDPRPDKSEEERDGKRIEPIAKPLLGHGTLARGVSVAEIGIGAFLLRDSWEREGPAKAMELIVGSLLGLNGLGRVIMSKGPLDHAFEILNNSLKSPE